MKNVCKDCANYGTNERYLLSYFRSIVILVFVGCAIAPAWAQNPLVPAGQFNIFTEGNVKLATNESEGPVATNGNGAFAFVGC